ncbi:hypothetical protein Tco_0190679 [Tanacetum coccineum]
MEYMMKNMFGLRWNCKELKGIVKLRFFRLVTMILQWLKDGWRTSNPEEKTNTDCLVKEQEKEYQTGWKIKTGNILDFCNQRSTQQCMNSVVAKHLGVTGLHQQNGLVDEKKVTLFAKVHCFVIQSGLYKVFWTVDTTMSTYLVNRSPSSAIEFKKPIDMLGFFGWLASIKQGMLKPVKVLHGFEFWVEPQKNVDQGAGLQEVQTQDLIDYQLARDRDQHLACEVFGYREDNNEDAFTVAVVEKIYAHKSLTFNNTVAYEVTSKWKAGLKDGMDARSDVYMLSNGCRKCSDNNDGYYLEYTPDKAKGNVLEGHSILLLEVSLSRYYDVEKNVNWSCIYAFGSREYLMVCTRLDISSADVGMLDKADRGLQTRIQVFVDFDYAMGRSITHMEALSTTEAGYMTFTEAWKKEIWLKGL